MAVTDDPFASAPEPDEAQAEETYYHDEPDPEEAPTPPKKTPAKKAPAKAAAKAPAAAVVNSSEGKVVLTFKGGGGYDAPWIVIHATDMDDALDQVSGENAAKLATVMERVSKAGQHFSDMAPKKANTGGGSGGGGGNSGGGRSNAPQAAQEAPNGEERFCAHGKMQYKTGVGKNNGKPWKAFMCGSGDRNDQCDPQWVR